ncbi:hypothetical protein ACVBEF_19405 [Glaciimonas sp. GG7]
MPTPPLANTGPVGGNTASLNDIADAQTKLTQPTFSNNILSCTNRPDVVRAAYDAELQDRVKSLAESLRNCVYSLQHQMDVLENDVGLFVFEINTLVQTKQDYQKTLATEKDISLRKMIETEDRRLSDLITAKTAKRDNKLHEMNEKSQLIKNFTRYAKQVAEGDFREINTFWGLLSNFVKMRVIHDI